MIPNNDEENYDGYSSDYFKKELKEIAVEIAEEQKRYQDIRNRMEIYKKNKGNGAASIQQVVVCLITIKKFKNIV